MIYAYATNGSEDGDGDGPRFLLLDTEGFGLLDEPAVAEVDEKSASHTDDDAAKDVARVMHTEVDAAIAGED